MRPPLAGKRAAARRLAEEVRRRLEPVERVLPVRLPRFEPAARPASEDAASAGAPSPLSPSPSPSTEDVAARIDAARERLRATIEPPAERDDERAGPAT